MLLENEKDMEDLWNLMQVLRKVYKGDIWLWYWLVEDDGEYGDIYKCLLKFKILMW